MASSRAVRPLGIVNTSLPWMSSTDCVKSEISSGRSAKAIMKNSSCGFAVLKNSLTASRDLSILLLMLPLTSKMTPMETGASSLEKFLISCGSLPSRMEKFSRSRPVTSRFRGSVMVTGTRTNSTPTFIGFSRVFREAGATRSAGTAREFAAAFLPEGRTGTATAGGTPGSGILACAGGRIWGSSRGFCAQPAGIRADAKQTPSERALNRVHLRGDNIQSSTRLALLQRPAIPAKSCVVGGASRTARKTCLLTRILTQAAVHDRGRFAQTWDEAEALSVEAFGRSLRPEPWASFCLLQCRILPLYGDLTSLPRVPLRPGPGSTATGCDPTLRQDHPRHAGEILRGQPLQPGADHSGED